MDSWLSPDHLEERLAARCAVEVDRPGLRPAAVLIPVWRDGDDLCLWLIRRPQSMPTHAGQISLPGGGVQAEDADLGATALRETEEELGCPRVNLRLLGRLDETWTPSGYKMSPFVGWVANPLALAPDPREVDGVIQTSVRQLTREGVYREDWWAFEGVNHRMAFFDLPEGTVWGATSRILFRFLQVCLGWKPEVDTWEGGPSRPSEKRLE